MKYSFVYEVTVVNYFFIVLFMLFSMSAETRAETWHTYHNEDSGAMADIPVNWIKISPPESIDGGDLFSSPDYHATIRIQGFQGGSSLPEGAVTKTDKDELITYEKRSPYLVVVSGTKGDEIFYRKLVSICGGTMWSDLLITYPISEKSKYRSLVERVSKSLVKQQCNRRAQQDAQPDVAQ